MKKQSFQNLKAQLGYNWLQKRRRPGVFSNKALNLYTNTHKAEVEKMGRQLFGGGEVSDGKA